MARFGRPRAPTVRAPSSSRPSSSRPSGSGSSRPSSSRPSGSGSSRPSGSGRPTSTSANDMLTGPGPERPYVNPNAPPNKPLPPTPTKPKPPPAKSAPSKKPADAKKPDAKDTKGKKDKKGFDLDAVDTGLQAVETGIYAMDVLGGQDEDFYEEGTSTNQNTDGGSGNPEGANQPKSQEPLKPDQDPVSKPLEDKVKNNGLQEAAQNVVASETGDSGVSRDEYLKAINLVNKYEQYGCSKKDKPKVNPINNKPQFQW